MPVITVIYGEQKKLVNAQVGSLVGEVIARTGLPLEQPCAGRGTCGKCKIMAETGLAPPDEIERKHLTEGELALNNRLACRAIVESNAQVILSPIVVYSNKIFHSSDRFKRSNSPLGLAVDLGTTTVAVFLTMLDDREVCAGSASLNQQAVFGADVISRLAAAINDPENADRLHRLALASINQAIDALNLSKRVRSKIERVCIVGNVAMHHLLARLPLNTLAVMPFQPYERRAILDAGYLMEGIFPKEVKVSLAPMIGGFVGSDALACLAYFGFDHPTGPMAAIDLGTNGEVMVTDGRRILCASTAAGPAFEGVYISCGTRAVDGAIVKVTLEENQLIFDTIGGESPIGLTGSGLLSLIYELRKMGVIAPNGRFEKSPPRFKERLQVEQNGSRKFRLSENGKLSLSQWDIRELQKAKGAVRAAVDILMGRLGLQPQDMERVILTGSFGAQVDLDAVIGIGMIPPVRYDVVEMIPNGAGFGAAMFLSNDGFQLGEELAAKAEQVDLDQDENFIPRYIGAMSLSPESYPPVLPKRG